MALSDVFMATFEQHVSGSAEQLLNMFFYRKNTGLGTAQDLWETLTDDGNLIDLINNCQVTQVVNSNLKVINLGDLEDFYDVGVPNGGVLESEMLPIFNAMSFTLKLSTRAVKPGRKSFSGLGESFQANGVITFGDVLGNMEVLRIALAAVTGVTGGIDYQPVVIKRVLRAADETHPNPRYTLPITDEELVVADVVAAVFSTRIKHQTSRGNGR